jgi:hypothetical protein
MGPRPYQPGARLTITGTNYADDAKVTLVPASGQPAITLAPASNTTPSQTSLTVVIPTDVYPGPHAVRVQNANGGTVEQQIIVVHPSSPDEAKWATNDGRLPPAPAPAPAPAQGPRMRPRPGLPVTSMPVRPTTPATATAGKLWNDPSNFDVGASTPDYGIYWFRTSTDGRKSGGTGQNDAYFNPNKPTVIYVHGWQQDTHLNPPANGIDRRRETLNFNGVDAVTLWKQAGQDWNVGIFYWDAFANEDENVDGPKPPWKAEPKIWTTRGPTGMRWRRGDGSFVIQPVIEKDAGTLFVEAFIEAMRNTSAPEIRIVGHSLGNQMAVRLTKEVGDRVARGELPVSMMPKRVALLDPYWTSDAKDWLGGKWTGEVVREYVRDLKRTRNVVFEQYQSSNMNDWFAGDKNHELQSMTAFLRLDPDYVDTGFLGVRIDKQFRGAHGAAIEWYFRSKTTGTFLCTRNVVNAVEFTRTALPSAAMPTEEVRRFMNDGGYDWYRQAWGEKDPSPQGDCFEKK